MGIPHEGEELKKWVKYTHDRPFNDHRYAVDGTKLRQLGWDQKTSFEEGLRITVDWYRRFGERWWGDISKVLSPFPVVKDQDVHSDKEPITDTPQPTITEAQHAAGVKKVKTDGEANGLTA